MEGGPPNNFRLRQGGGAPKILCLRQGEGARQNFRLREKCDFRDFLENVLQKSSPPWPGW